MIKPHNLIQAAPTIKCDHDEVALRCSIHVAYYGLYHSALKLAETSLGFSAQSHSRHEQLQRFLMKHSDAQVRRVGVALKNAKHQRTDADYKLGKTITQDTQRDHVAMCRDACDLVKELEGRNW